MPKTSKQTASRLQDMGVMECRYEELGGYARPGHTPALAAGTELIEFSPTEEHGRTMEVVGHNLVTMQEA